MLDLIEVVAEESRRRIADVQLQGFELGGFGESLRGDEIGVLDAILLDGDVDGSGVGEL